MCDRHRLVCLTMLRSLRLAACVEDAEFDPATDRWAATWTGPIEGCRYDDPDGIGTGASRHWTGAFNLQIEAADPSRVRACGENMEYEREIGGPSGMSPDNIPTSRADAWFATPVGTSGRKGCFHGSEVIGRLEAAPAGTTPARAIGRIHDGGHTAVFEVLK